MRFIKAISFALLLCQSPSVFPANNQLLFSDSCRSKMMKHHMRATTENPFFNKILHSQEVELTSRQFLQAIVNDLHMYRALEEHIESTGLGFAWDERMNRAKKLEADRDKISDFFKIEIPSPTQAAIDLEVSFSERDSEEKTVFAYVMYTGLLHGTRIVNRLSNWLEGMDGFEKEQNNSGVEFYQFDGMDPQARRELATDLKDTFNATFPIADESKHEQVANLAEKVFLNVLHYYAEAVLLND